MIKENESEFRQSNIHIWQKDNLGEGTTIVVLDEGFLPFPYMADSVTVMDFGYDGDKERDYGHGSAVLAVGYQIAPKGNIIYMPFNSVKSDQKWDMLEWIIKHSEEIDVITMSLNWADIIARKYFDTIKWLEIPFFVASGNDGDREDGVNAPANFDYTIAVGAYNDGTKSLASYTNGGPELDCVAFSATHMLNSRGEVMTQSGTSFSTPYAAFASRLYMSWRKRNGFPKMKLKECKEWIRQNAYDLVPNNSRSELKVGFDNASGWGLFRLPPEVLVIQQPEPEKPVEVAPSVPDEVPSVPDGVPTVSEPITTVPALRLIIDAGHGGLDTGGYYKGYREKDLNIVIAKRVKELLKRFKPHMTREDDITIIWDKRAAMIKDKYDYCISIHFNIGEGEGVEAIHSHLSSKGKTLATQIVNGINETAGIPKRPNAVYSKKNTAGQDYYYMHRLTGNTVTVIVECMFLDNPHENDINKLNVEKIAQGIANGFIKFAGIPVIANPPKTNPVTIRKYDSNIHVFETSKGMIVDQDKGVRFVREKLTKIMNDKIAAGEKILAGINCGFFNSDKTSEHIGEDIDEGKYYNPPTINSVEFTYYKDGHTEITNRHGYDQVVLSRIQGTAHWSIGTSYSLVKDGKINLMLTEKYAHSGNKEPRTMIGQKADGTFVLAVADGRSTVSKGMTAQEQAEFMLSMGCINAVNLDGGGSSVMAVVKSGNPVIVNKPSDDTERLIGSVILVKGV